MAVEMKKEKTVRAVIITRIVLVFKLNTLP